MLFVSRLGKFKPFLFYYLIVLIKSEINQVFGVLLLPIRPKKLQFFGKAGGGRRDEEEPRPWRLRSICHTQTLSLSHTHTPPSRSPGELLTGCQISSRPHPSGAQREQQSEASNKRN